MGVKERTLEFISRKGVSTKHFEELCGLSNGYISSMRKSFGSEKLENVLNAFPELRKEWLLFGEGEMLKSNESVVKDNQAEYETGPSKDLKYYRDQCDRLLRTIENNSILMLKLQEDNERLRKELDEKFQKSNAHNPDAECAAAG